MTDITSIVDLNGQDGERTQYRVAPEKRLAGDPVQTVVQHFASPCGRFGSGIWESTPGHWRIAYTEAEYCEILQGVSVIRDEQGHEKVLRVGDRFVIPSGFRGTWEVVEACRKIYVVYEPQTGGLAG